MNCTFCNYHLSNFEDSANCPKCQGKGVPKPPVSPPPVEAPPRKLTIPRPAPLSVKQGKPLVAIVGLIAVLIVVGFALFNFFGLEIKPKSVNTPVVIPTSVPVVTPSAAPLVAPVPYDAATREDEEYIRNMNKVMENFPGTDITKNPSDETKFAVVKDDIRKAQMQMSEVPPPLRFVKAHSLFGDSLREMSLGITTAELGGISKSQNLLDESKRHLDSASEIRTQAMDEFVRVIKDLRAK